MADMFNPLLEEDQQNENQNNTLTVGGGVTPELSTTDRLLQEMEDSKPDPAPAIEVTIDTDPDENQERNTTADKLGVPREVVDEAPEEAKRASKTQELLDNMRDAPSTSKFMSNPGNAAIAHDDVPVLTRIENFFSALYEDLTQVDDAFEQGVDQVDTSHIGFEQLLEVMGLTGPVSAERLARADAFDRQQQIKSRTFIGGIGIESGRQIPILGQTIAAGAGTAAVGAGTGAVVGSVVPGPGTVAGAVTGAGYGFKVGSASSAFQLESGLAYREFSKIKTIDGQLMDPEIAGGAAIVVGAINAGLELFSINLLAKTIPGGDKLLSFASRKTMKEALQKPTVQRALRRIVKRYAQAAAGEGVTEAAQEIVNMLGGAVAEIIQGGEYEKLSADQILERVLHSAEAGLQAGLGIGAAGSTVSTANEIRKVRKAREHRDKMAQVMETAKESVLKDRSPEAFELFYQGLAEDAGRETIDLRTDHMLELFQTMGIDPVEAFEELGVGPEEVNKALEQGSDISVETARFFAAVGNNENMAEYLLNVRENPGGMTLAEAEVAQQNITEIANQVLEQTGISTTEDGAVNAQQIGDAIAEQARASGIYSAEGARNIGLLYQAIIETEQASAEAEGKEFDVAEAFADMGVNIRRIPFAQRGQPVSDQLLGDPAVLNQEAAQYGVDAEQLRVELQEAGGEITQTRTFKEWFAESVVQEQKPFTENPYPLIPQVVYHSTRVDDIREFRPFTHFGTAKAANDRTNAKLNFSGQLAGVERGIPEEDIAAWWRDLPSEERRAMSDEFFERGVSVMPVYLSIQSPLSIDDNDNWGDPRNLARDLVDDGVIEWEDYLEVDANPTFDTLATILELAGYDGIRYQNTVEDPGSISYIAFRPEQVKSVFNQGTFNLADRDILRQSAVPLGVGVEQKNKHGLAPFLREMADVNKADLPEKPAFMQTTNNKNAAAQVASIDEILARHPRAHDSAKQWSQMMAEALASDDVPIPPYRFLSDINAPAPGSNTIAAVDNLLKLTPGQIADADHGFQNGQKFRAAYLNGNLGVETTGKLFLWSFLSRGVSPYAQESLFIDAYPGIDQFMQDAAAGELDIDAYLAWADTIAPKGSGRPGAGSKHNLNAFGKDFLTKMSQDVGDGTGRSRLQALHDMMADPNMTGKEIRRQFAQFGQGVGIDNKVVSFTLLVAGYTDVMILDRVQIRQLWDDGRFQDRNLYDGNKVETSTGKTMTETGTSLAKLIEGARGIFVYEALERAIEEKLPSIYGAIGRPKDASVGRYHWETWVADSEQEASHGTIDAIMQEAAGDKTAIHNVASKQGEYGSYAYGARYGMTGDGVGYFNYPTKSGKIYTFTVPGFVDFMQAIQNPATGVVPNQFKVTESGNAPWYERSEVNQDALEAAAAQFSEGLAGKRAGTVQGPGGDQFISDGSAATAGLSTGFAQDQLFQTPTQRKGLGLLYDPLERIIEDLKLDQWKTRKDQTEPPRAKGPAIWEKLQKIEVPAASDQKDMLKWSGLEEFLTASIPGEPPRKFTRQDVIEFLQGNAFVLDETIAAEDTAEQSLASSETPYEGAGAIELDIDKDNYQLLPRDHPENEDRRNRLTEDVKGALFERFTEMDYFELMREEIEGGPYILEFMAEMQEQLRKNTDFKSFRELEREYMRLTGDGSPVLGTPATPGNITGDLFDESIEETADRKLREWERRVSDWIRRDPKTGLPVPQGATTGAAITEEPIDEAVEEQFSVSGLPLDQRVFDGAEPNQAGLGLSLADFFDDAVKGVAQQIMDDEPLASWKGPEGTGIEIIGTANDYDGTGYFLNGEYIGGTFEEALNAAKKSVNKTRSDERLIPRWEFYDGKSTVMPGDYENYREIKLILPEILEGQKFSHHYPDDALLGFLRVTDREFIDQAAFKAFQENLESRPDRGLTDIYVAEDLAQRPEFWPPELLEEYTNTRDRYNALEAMLYDEDIQFGEALRETLDDHHNRMRLESADLQEAAQSKRMYGLDEMQSDIHQKSRGVFRIKATETQRDEATEQLSRQREIIARAVNRMPTSVRRNMLEAFNNSLKITDSQWRSKMEDAFQDPNRTGFGEAVIQFYYSVYRIGNVPWLEYKADKPDVPENATHKAKLWNYVKYWSDKNEDINAFFEALKEEKKLDDFLERSDPDNKTKYFPDTPFENTGWHSLMLKRALVDAAERGMEKFAWPNLQAMLERWSGTAEESFSKQYNQSMVKKVKQLTGQKPKEYDFAFNEITEASLEKQAEELVERPQIQIPDQHFGVTQGLNPDQIAFDQVGYDEWTELRNQLTELHEREQEGVDIIWERDEQSLAYLEEFYRNSISSEGPVQRKLNELNEFARRAGLYPESITIELVPAPVMMNTRLVPSFGYQFVWKKPTRIDEDGNVTDFEMVELGKPAGAAGETYLFREGREALDEFFRTSPLRALRKYVTKKPAGMWIIDLPQELRDEILTGEYFARMQEDDTAAADPLGAFNLTTGSIDLFENADFSTLLHESGHVFVTFLERLAQRENASERTKEIYQSMLDWVGAENADDLNIRINGEAAIEKQERLARAFEAYLKEGKAPSAKLQNAFAMFKQWLMRIYNRIRQLDIVIDDEIRQVFDRMLATDREIEEMKQMNAFDLSSPSVMGLMSDEERSNYTRLMNDADEEARAEAARAQAEAAARADQDWWKRSLEKMKTAVEKEMFETNAPYRAFYFLTRGKFRSGPTAPELEGKKLLKQDLLDMGLTQEQLNALPRAASRIYSTSEENTLSPTVMAAALNFSSAEEMIDVLTNMVPVAEAVQRNAEMQMRSEFGDPLNDGTTEQLAEEALYNDKRRRAIEIELDALATATGQQKVGKAVVKAIVDRVFNEVAVGELLTPMKYQAASVRAAKEAERAAAAGDNMLAFEKKRQQLLNHELFRRGLAARDEVEKITKKLRDIQRKKQDGKKIDPDYIAQVNNLLRFYELGNMSLKRFEENTASIASSVMQFIENQRLAGEPIVLPGDLVEVVSFDSNGQPVYSFKTTHWRQMTMAEIKGLRDMVDNLMKVGRNNSEAEKEALKLRAENLGVAIDQNTRPRKVRDKKLLKPRRKKQQKSINIGGWWASHRKLESLLRQLDGFEAMGPAWREIFQDLADAQDSKVKMVRESLDALNRIFKDYSLKERMMNGTQKIDVLGVGITKEQAMTLLLNWGNETSREAVLEDTTMKEMYGDAWNEETINAIFDEVLTEKDLFTVNQIWEHIDSFWPQISALEREDTGVVPPKVDPDPFMVGQTLMRGGYYPLKYDNLNDSRVAVEKQQEINVGVMSGGFARAQTSHGFTIARVGSGGRAVRLDFGVLSEHLEEVTQDLAYRKAVRNADKMFKQPAVREAIVRALGQAHYNEMVGVLTSVAGAHIVDQPVGPVKALQWARMNTTIAIMGWNLKSILTQPFGLTQSMARIGFWNTAAGAVEFWGMPWKSAAKIREIHEKSEYMRDRSRTMTRELEETLNAINPPNIQDTLVKAAFAPMVITDVFGVAGPTWLGAYNSALSGKVENIMAGDEVDAIRYADSVVRTTQGSGGALNLSGIQQQGEAKKLLTMFYGYFNTTYNMMAEATQKARLDGGVKGASHLAAQTMYLIILPAIISGLMLEKWPDEEDTDDDPEKAWLKWALLQVFNYGAGTIVLGRDVARGVTTDFDFQLSPITGFFGNMARFADDAWEIAVDLADDGELEDGEIPDSAIKNAARLFGTLMKIPGTNQIVRSIDTWIKMEEDDLKTEPRNELERIQKLLFTGDR